MQRLLLPWSEIHVPGITATLVDTDTHPSGQVVHVVSDSANELAAAAAPGSRVTATAANSSVQYSPSTA